MCRVSFIAGSDAAGASGSHDEGQLGKRGRESLHYVPQTEDETARAAATAPHTTENSETQRTRQPVQAGAANGPGRGKRVRRPKKVFGDGASDSE